MADTTYVDLVGPPVNANWLNDVNDATYITTQSFTATEGQTTFTLSAIPRVGYSRVFWNGVYQVPNTAYSLVDNVITLSEGVYAGDVLYVEYY